VSVRSDIWNQLGGSPTGGAFRLVNTIRPNTLKCMVTLPGPTGLCSPVIGPDGAVYIGTLNGHLLAITDCSIRWSIDIAGFAYAVETPAVADDGMVYCLCRSMATVTDHRTPRTVGLPGFVVAVRPDGTVKWRVPLRALPDLYGTVNCEIQSAPRIVSGPRGSARLAFVLRYTLLEPYPNLGPGAVGPRFVRVLVIMNERGQTLLFNRYEEDTLFVDAQGGGGLFSPGATLGEGPSAGLPQHAAPYMDTPVVFGALPARQAWTIFAPGRRGLYKLASNDSNGALAQSPKLMALPYSAAQPAAFANGLVTGGHGYHVSLIDPATFTPYVSPPTALAAPATVSGGLRQMYFATPYGSLIAVDANGEIWKIRNLMSGSVALPAVSANHVHVAAADGLHTFSLDLQEETAFVPLPPRSAGFSSPAIAANGDVYVAAGAFHPSPGNISAVYAFFDSTNPLRGDADGRALSNGRATETTRARRGGSKRRR